MSTPISFIVSGSGTINAVVNSKTFVIPRTHRNYSRAKAVLRDNDGDKFLAAVDYEQILTNLVPPTRGRVEVIGGQVLYNGKPLHNVVTERILALAADGWPWGPVGNFLDNVEQNPSYRATQELYTFLEHRALPLTENGHFLAYKAVRPDWTDKHTGTFLNKAGHTVSVPRNTVNDDFREGCSNGLHVGSIEYVTGFKGDGDHVVICRVNPKDVVSVPLESGCTKLRCCEYEVVGEYTGDLTELVYTSQGNAVPPPSRNDPAQAVTTAPPPRDGGQWSGIDPATPGEDYTAVLPLERDGTHLFSPGAFSDDNVGLGPPVEEDDEDDDFDEDDDDDDEDDDYEEPSDLDDEVDSYVDSDDEIPVAEDADDESEDDAYVIPY